jgi:5S rRNA maturation endonuclease (ribonuclease M5)
MEKLTTFGNAELAKKMASQFGAKKSVQVKMRYAKEAAKFIQKVEEAHEKAANSVLLFG